MGDNCSKISIITVPEIMFPHPSEKYEARLGIQITHYNRIITFRKPLPHWKSSLVPIEMFFILDRNRTFNILSYESMKPCIADAININSYLIPVSLPEYKNTVLLKLEEASILGSLDTVVEQRLHIPDLNHKALMRAKGRS